MTRKATVTAKNNPFSNLDGIAAAIRKAQQHLLPPPDMKPSEWAQEHIRIPAGNAVPGPLRLDNAPYQREPMDMLVDPDCYRVTLMWGAQVGNARTSHPALRPGLMAAT